MIIKGHYLRKAAEEVKVDCSSELYNPREPKSLNPLLGETILIDGTDICVEQINHYPPISYMIVTELKKFIGIMGLQHQWDISKAII
jgi:hypothetical protein